MPDFAEAGVWVYDFTSNGISPATVNVTGNAITAGQDDYGGIWGNLLYAPAFTLNIANNTVNAGAGVTGTDGYTFGIYLTSLQDGTTATLTDNTVGATGGQFAAGINLWNLPTNTPVSVTGGSVGNSIDGILVDDNDINFGSAGASTAVTISGVTIGGATTAIAVIDTPSDLVSATISNSILNVPGDNTGILVSGSKASATLIGDALNLPSTGGNTATGIDDEGGTLTIGAGNTIGNGQTGLYVSGSSSAIAGDTLNNLTFTGTSGYYVDLESAALFQPGQPTKISAGGATFDGVLGSTAARVAGLRDRRPNP